jgi:hypothetical protein
MLPMPFYQRTLIPATHPASSALLAFKKPRHTIKTFESWPLFPGAAADLQHDRHLLSKSIVCTVQHAPHPPILLKVFAAGTAKTRRHASSNSSKSSSCRLSLESLEFERKKRHLVSSTPVLGKKPFPSSY